MSNISVICYKCNQSFNINEDIYNKRYKIRKRNPICIDCKKSISKEYQQSLTDEQRKAHSKKMSIISKQYYDNLSQEEKDKRNARFSNASREYLENLTDDQYKEYRTRLSSMTRSVYANMSDEDKKKRSEKLSKSMRNFRANMSDDERTRHSLSIREGISNMSDEQKKQRSDKLKKSTSIYMNSLSDDEKKLRSEKQSQSMKKHWDGMTIEERNKIGQKIRNGISNMSDESISNRSRNSSIAVKKQWNDLTQEEREDLSLRMSISRLEFYSNLPNEKRIELGKLISIGQNNMSQEDKNKANDKRSDSLKKYWEKLTREEYDNRVFDSRKGFNEYLKKINISGPNKNERDFINYLNSIFIPYKYQWYNKIKHERFDELFPYNHILDTKFIRSKHQWDFKLDLTNKTILIDIDGSIHDKEKTQFEVTRNNKKFILSDYIEFNDSQRLYQTDGYDAYIIQCYDDNLSDDTPVKNIQTNETINLSDFILFIAIYNISEKEYADIFKLL